MHKIFKGATAKYPRQFFNLSLLKFVWVKSPINKGLRKYELDVRYYTNF